jgi:hypothetical protein
VTFQGLWTVHYSALSIRTGSILTARTTAGAAAQATADSNTAPGNNIIQAQRLQDQHVQRPLEELDSILVTILHH